MGEYTSTFVYTDEQGQYTAIERPESVKKSRGWISYHLIFLCWVYQD